VLEQPAQAGVDARDGLEAVHFGRAQPVHSRQPLQVVREPVQRQVYAGHARRRCQVVLQHLRGRGRERRDGFAGWYVHRDALHGVGSPVNL